MSLEAVPSIVRTVGTWHHAGMTIRVVAWPGADDWRAAVQVRVSDTPGAEEWRLPSEVGPEATLQALRMLAWYIAQIGLVADLPPLPDRRAAILALAALAAGEEAP